MTDYEVCVTLKQVSLNKSPGLDGLPYKLYLRLSHIFVPILTDVFHPWFIQGIIPGHVTKEVITWLKKSGSYVWKGFNDCSPITLLNIAKDFGLGPTKLLTSCCWRFVKGRSILNLHLVCTILEDKENNTEAIMISLDQSKTFDWVDHQFLAAVLETVWFKPELCWWISILYQFPMEMGQMNVIKWSVQQGCLLSPILYVLALEPLL